MKINELKNIKNFAFSQNFSKNETKTPLQNGVDEFSHEYSEATKSLVSPQVNHKSFEEMQEELIDELVKKGVFKSRTEAGYFVYYRVSKDNYNLAKIIFDCKHIPTKTAIGVVKNTHKENEPVAQAMVSDEEFPPNCMEDILMATNSNNIQSSLAACKNKHVSKVWVPGYLARINQLTDCAASHILADQNIMEFSMNDAIHMLNSTSALLVCELYSLFDNPHPSAVVLMAGKQKSENIDMYLKALRTLKQDEQFDSDCVSSAIFALSKRNEAVFYEMLEELLPDKEIPRAQIAKVVSSQSQDNHHGRKKVFRTLRNDFRISKDDLMDIIRTTTNKNANLRVSVYDDLKDNPDFPIEYLTYTLTQVGVSEEDFDIDSVLPENFVEGAKKFREIHKNLLKNPELYINGEVDMPEYAQEEIEDFVKDNFLELCSISAFLDKETIDILFRGRLENVEDYLEKYETLKQEPLNLPYVFNSKNKEGKSLTPKEQIELLDLLNAMASSSMSFDNFNQMINKKGYIDFELLQKDLFLHILRSSGIKVENIDEEKIKAWDLKYVPYLAQELNEMIAEGNEDLSKIVCAACAEDDFIEYIQGDNEFGWANCLTQEQFEKLGLDYGAWLNPSKTNEVQFKLTDSNQEKLSQIIGQIEEDIEELRKTPAKGFIDKHFRECISNGKFKINEKYSKNKQSLEAFMKHMFEFLDNNIFKRAQGNLNNPSKKQNAQMTLTIKSHLEQRLEDIKTAHKAKKEKPIDLTIKMWDRNPIHDLFQGNYSTCCIGLTRGNGSAMPNYLGYSAFNMIELVDNISKQTIGNALCYFVQDENQNPVFVIDNIEIANKNKPSDEGGLKLRNAILQYAKNVVKEVCSKDVPILLGASYNDVPDEDLKECEGKPSIVGEFNCDEIYVDAFGGWVCPEYFADDDDIEVGLKILN